MPKYCPECGSLMDEYSDFCRECGARSSTHKGGYVPWSAKKSIKSQDNSKRVFNSNSDDSYSKHPLGSDNTPRRERRGIFKLLPTFIGLVSIILIFCLISSGMLNLDGHNSNVVMANSTNISNSLTNITDNQTNDTVDEPQEDNTSSKNSLMNKTYLLIEYESSWQGSVGTSDNMLDYTGNGTKKIEFVNMAEDDVISASVQKQDASENSLTIKLIKNGLVIKEATTSTPYGVVTVTE